MNPVSLASSASTGQAVSAAALVQKVTMVTVHDFASAVDITLVKMSHVFQGSLVKILTMVTNADRVPLVSTSKVYTFNDLNMPAVYLQIWERKIICSLLYTNNIKPYVLII